MSSGADAFMMYGVDGMCWMSWQHRGLIYLFLAPSGIALLCNTALVVATALTLFQIRKSQSGLPVSRGLTVECVFSIVTRISVSMGLEWTLGFFLYIAPHCLGLRYAFVLVVGLHGFWILISTLTLGVWRRLVIKRRPSSAL